MNNRKMKITAILLAVTLILSGCTSAYASGVTAAESAPAEEAAPAQLEASKNDGTELTDRAVYVLAGADGNVKKIIVSDWVKEAMGADTYSVGDDSMKVWDAQGNRLYYSGEAEKELPVSLSMSYTLDGKPISAEELAGKSGKVSIRFDYQNMQKQTVKIDGQDVEMSVPFAMLTGLILDSDKFSNVSVTNGKLFNDGSRIAVIGIAFPGLQEDLSLDREKLELPEYVEITADVKDFSMGMTVNVAADGLFSELDTSKLDSVDELESSMGKLSDAMAQLIDGSSALYDGLAVLLDKSSELVNGLDQLAVGAAALKDGAQQLEIGLGEISIGAIQLDLGQSQLAGNSGALNSGAQQVFETLLAEAEQQLTASGLSVPALTPDNYAEVLSALAESLNEASVRAQALQTVTDAVEARRSEVEAAVIAAVREQVNEKVTEVVRGQVQEQVTQAVRQEVTRQVNEAARQQVIEKVTDAARDEVTSQIVSTVLFGMSLEDYRAAVEKGTILPTVSKIIDAAVELKMSSDEVKALIEENVEQQMVSDEVKASIEAAVESKMAEPEIQAQIDSLTDSTLASDDIQAQLSAAVEQQMATQEIADTVAANTDEQVRLLIEQQMESDEVKAKLAEAEEGRQKILSLIASLDDYKTFYEGLSTYTAGVSAAAAGTKTLSSAISAAKDGSSALSSGAVSLYEGILEMKNGVPVLVEGVTQLKDGSMQLSDGLNAFNEEGLQKLTAAVNGDIGGLLARVRAIIDISKNCRSFAGISDASNMTYIYRTDEIISE